MTLILKANNLVLHLLFVNLSNILSVTKNNISQKQTGSVTLVFNYQPHPKDDERLCFHKNLSVDRGRGT